MSDLTNANLASTQNIECGTTIAEREKATGLAPDLTVFKRIHPGLGRFPSRIGGAPLPSTPQAQSKVRTRSERQKKHTRMVLLSSSIDEDASHSSGPQRDSSSRYTYERSAGAGCPTGR
jgi:hypothetical protein